MNAVVHSLYICWERRYFIHSLILMLCANSLLVPSCFSWFHLRTSEIVLILTIAVANFVFCWEMVCAHSFLIMNFLFFESVCCWFCLGTVGSTVFQEVPALSRWFLFVQGSSSLFIILLHEGCIKDWKCCCKQFLVSCFGN